MLQFNSMLSTKSPIFDTCSTPISVKNMSWIFMFLFLSTRGILRIHSCSGNLCFQRILHLHRFPFWHLHGIPQLVRCHHQLEPDMFSEFPLDWRARCSAILVPRLLSIVHNISFCQLQLFAEPEIEDVVFDVDWNELFRSAPTQHSFEMHPHFVAVFGCALESWNHRWLPYRNLMVLRARFLQHCTLPCVLQTVFHSEIDTNHCHRNLETAKLHR